ncbi:acyl-ACP--UDP-N-acetylglucosamine O-acyltransferase [Porphyromonas circumdentaria]|uniref:Acyl-[acyl-carrier-protein]--UDP-N-acetylglucosamine O-acyltransferase n=1 Tax=Porphyromonas circumdentaria TaxID=29524 RepID=A0A1T4NE67_9PORP|nr:acyl-ACP--UDP-N-acetylglucosamine O-acyltransferase [Porphyromonas circumdentaria]MBB6275652.1 UDP-N-acetylglucosamine acyltransferase [Porphyromonas circumdentaria]MDO4721891.1 acyl-ACP--UDP-N-acetylglucosamine O-acyltransferase [Porphyromonas circumdentaria]SJZ77560.1 acyl-[acyl-carrier-protein]--UDP-N-acetylglucosamine O-acyltransferase [Porphyromonas circumdentaria]
MTQETFIHPQALVHSKAQIGQGAYIDAFSIVEENTEIGDNTILHPHSIVRSGSRIGNHCNIHPGAVIGGIPQDLKFKNEETLAIIGDKTTVREYATVNRGTASRGFTKVGDECLLMAYSHVAHDCVLNNNIIIGNATQIAGEVLIDDFAILSGGVLVHQFVNISQHVMIQGGSKVTKDIPPYIIIGRDPIAYCGINIVGLRRRGFTDKQIFLIGDIYRTLYLKGLNNTDALNTIALEYPSSDERDLILNFIKNSQRGIVRSNLE